MSKQTDEAQRVERILNRLEEEYGPAHCYLDHEKPWQLLMATILSAQCTDARVNLVTPHLWAKYPTLEALAAADPAELEAIIRPTGFYHSKAGHLLGCSRMLLERFGGVVPESMEDLTSLPGVGRKTANLIRGYVYQQPGVVVDTHVKRIAKKLGLTQNTDPVKVEFDLRDKLPPDHWLAINSQLIALGRTVCTARKPHCDRCFLWADCPSHS